MSWRSPRKIGDSLVERDRFDEVRAVMAGAGTTLIELPQDVVAAPEVSADANAA